MSVERDLLGRWHNGDLLPEEYMQLMKETKELLAQPEQEPVAWCQMVEGKVQDLLTSFEMKDWLYDKSWIPLYLAPPKREPLSDEEIVSLWANKSPANEFECVRLVEKAHGITGGGE